MSDERPRTVDVRLVPVAAATWLAALVVPRLPTVAAVAAGGALVLAAGAVLVAGHRADRDGRRTLAGGVALAAAGAAAVLLAGGGQTAVREPLRTLAEQTAAVRLEATVVGDAAALPPAWPGAPPRQRWLLDADSVETAGARRRVVGQVVVLAPAASGRSVPADGVRVAVDGRLRPTGVAERAVALLLADSAPRVERAAPWWRAGAGDVRSGLTDVAAGVPGDAGALLPAVAVGDTSGVSTDLADAMRTAGMTHLVAVSGAHFALVAALVLAATGAVGLGARARAGVTALVAAALVVVVHPVPSVVRAAAMGALAVLGLLVGRPARAVAALAAAVVVLLVLDPWLAGELGFALSVAATAGLVLLGTPLAERWTPRLGRAPAAVLAVPVAAQLVCAPLVVLATPAVNPWAVPANLLAAPAVAPATVLGLAAAVVAPWSPVLAAVPATAAAAACWWIAQVARTAAVLPGASLAWLPGPFGAALLALACGATARALVRRGPRGRVGRVWHAGPRAAHHPLRPSRLSWRGPGSVLAGRAARPGRAGPRPRGSAGGPGDRAGGRAGPRA